MDIDKKQLSAVLNKYNTDEFILQYIPLNNIEKYGKEYMAIDNLIQKNLGYYQTCSSINGYSIVAVHDNKIVGVIIIDNNCQLSLGEHCVRRNNVNTDTFVADLVSEGRYYGVCGIGSALLNAATDISRNISNKKSISLISVDNTDTVQFYLTKNLKMLATI